MNLLDTIAMHQQQTNQANMIDQDQGLNPNSVQARNALLMAFLHMNPKMMEQLGSRSQEYMKQLMSQQGGQ